MTAFKTIQEAHKNGTGNLFFCKSGKYIAIEEEPVKILYLQEKGYEFLTDEEVRERIEPPKNYQFRLINRK